MLFSVMAIASGFPVSAKKERRPDINSYVANHRFLAKVLSVIYGIPSPIILGVAIVESSAGTCDVAVVLNNHFGIAGRNHYKNRYGHKSRYKQYHNDIESYIDFCIYLSHKRYYRRLRYKKNINLWIEAMSAKGYSEMPEEWAFKIRHTIKEHHLK